mmetsp:Transcript_2373/g.3110  ORF Transcript_2373/g.3110 Transcript_2373/m.3110 type:complete len:639 (+) Transcript_2373:153-2069(+)
MTHAPTNQHTTLGMRIDAVLQEIDSISPTVLYSVILVASILFSMILLNTGGGRSTEPPRLRDDVTKPSRKIQRFSDEPQPKWYILKFCNYAAVIGFAFSIFKFAIDATTYINDSTLLMKFTVCWSLFMCYFFGFFGISFVDADEIEQRAVAGGFDGREGREVERKGILKGSITRKEHEYPIHSPPQSIHPVCNPNNADIAKKQLPDKSPSSTRISDIKSLSDVEIASLVTSNKIKDHQLEKLLDPRRAVDVRRIVVDSKLSSLGRGGALADLPSSPSLDYSRVFGANCEIVVGYVPIPVGMVGPLTLNGETVYIPMATTEGCLVASTNRGCKAISAGSGAHSSIVRDGITRAPCLRLNSTREAADLMLWCEDESNFKLLKQAFESTTSFGKLLRVDPTIAGRNVYLRLKCFSGDAMGMNMVSKGSLAVVDYLRTVFPTITLVALSGNVCTDKKAAAINWIEGRGKSVVVEATIPQHVVRSTLKTTVEAIVSTNIQKNLIGSAMAGTVGGFNAHASNIVTAVFIATGQDPAQNVESSNCMTLMEETPTGDLWISCTMPSIEVGTVGGGTGLPAQAACLKAMGCQGGAADKPGANAKQLAHVVASATMAGELSLMAALAANTLVQAHMQHNRKPTIGKKA